MRCAEVLERLSDYIDDELTLALRREVERHIAGCRTCEVFYDSLCKTLRLVTDAGTLELPAPVSERVLQRILSALEDELGHGGSAPPDSPVDPAG